MRYDLDEIVDRVDRLPVPNPTALQVIRLCADPEALVSDIALTIASDQSLTAQVLRVANSSYFNYPREINSIDRAIVILGFRLLKDISLSFAFHSFYRGLAQKSRLNLQEMWEHAMLSAYASRAAARHYHIEDDALLFTGGLLHDLGKLAMDQVAGEDYRNLFLRQRETRQRLYVIEEEIFNFHHGDVGGILIDRWNLPLALVSMVTYHHYPGDFSGDSKTLQQIKAVYLGNIIAHFIKREWTGFADIEAFDANFVQFFRLNAIELEQLAKTTREETQQAAMLQLMPSA